MVSAKKAAPAGTKKASGSAPAHASYQDMVKEAIISLKERNGSSRQAIKKYIQANNNLGATTDAAFTTHLSKALAAGEKNGVFSRPKGPSGPVKLAKKDSSKPAAKAASSTTTKSTTKSAAKPAAKKASGTKSTTKKTAAPKKTSTTTKTAAPKKTAAKPKANAGRPRKTAPAAPAVEDKPVVLGKTKSGRVTKSTAPAAPKQARKPSAKKAATKKSTPKKAATPKKSEAPAQPAAEA